MKEAKYLRLSDNVYWISAHIAARQVGAPPVFLRLRAVTDKSRPLIKRASARLTVPISAIKEEIVALLHKRFHHALLVALAGGVLAASSLVWLERSPL